jgi:hypothetical protein
VLREDDLMEERKWWDARPPQFRMRGTLPMIVGTVIYRSSEKGPLHRTGFSYILRRKGPDGAIYRELGDIPAEDLALDRSVWDGRVE